MRVGSVSGVYSRQPLRKGALKQQSDEKSGEIKNDVSFKGNFGKIIGGTAGLAGVVAASFAFPPLICLAGAGLAAGVVGGDVAEDKINKEGEYKEKKDEDKP